MKITFKSDMEKVVGKVRKMSEEAQTGTKTQVLKSAMQVEAVAKSLAPSKTSKLRGSIKTKLTNGGMGAEVTATAAHAAYVEYNTRAHIIKAKKAKALKFNMDGKTMFRKWVRHPGTKEQPFMRPALERERPHFIRELTEIVGRKL